MVTTSGWTEFSFLKGVGLVLGSGRRPSGLFVGSRSGDSNSLGSGLLVNLSGGDGVAVDAVRGEESVGETKDKLSQDQFRNLDRRYDRSERGMGVKAVSAEDLRSWTIVITVGADAVQRKEIERETNDKKLRSFSSS